MADTNTRQKRYSDAEREGILKILDDNGGNVAKTSRQTGVRKETIRKWQSARAGVQRCLTDRPTDDGASDLRRFSKDSWDIIHKANEVVKDGIEDLGARDAATIASGYFDRQTKAEDRLADTDKSPQEYAAEWDGDAK